jgi:O-acetylserine/cysteine efflux transporter
MPDAPHHERFGAFEYLVILFINVSFALNMIAIKVVVDATSPFTASSLRMAIVFLLCAPALRFVRGKTLALAAYGAVNGGLFLLLLNAALTQASNVSALAIAGQLSVPFSLLLGALIYRERLSLKRMGGVALALLGVGVLGFDPAIANEVAGVLIMISAAFTWAVGALIQRGLSGVTAMNSQAWNGLMGALVLAPFAIWMEPDVIAHIPDMQPLPMAWLAFSCIGSTILGQGSLAWLLQRHPISTVTPLMLAAPVLAALLASLYFGTRITPAMIVGGVIALTGVIVIARTAPKAVPPPLD